MTPAVSVLMPVLNPHPDYFPAAVRSVLAQTLADWELVIVEDPSPSSAAALLAPLADPRIRHFRNPERTGLQAQRNRTLAEARGEFVAMLDADDIAEPDRLAKQVAFLRQRPDVAAVGCFLRIIDNEGRDCGFREYPTDPDAIRRAMPRYNAVPQPGLTARTEAIRQVGGYQLAGPSADYELWSRMMRAGLRFAHLPEPLVRYRNHPGAIKSTQLRQTLTNTLWVKRTHWWGEMGWADRARYAAEWGLRLVPAGLVLRLFRRTHYRPTLSR